MCIVSGVHWGLWVVRAGTPRCSLHTRISLELIGGVLQRYDVLSAMMGSMLVTTLAVMHGQSLSTAAGLTVVSTVMALVRFQYRAAFLQPVRHCSLIAQCVNVCTPRPTSFP